MNWLEVLRVIVLYEVGRMLYSELKIQYKIRKGTAWKSGGYTIQGPQEWVDKASKTIQSLLESAKTEVEE